MNPNWHTYGLVLVQGQEALKGYYSKYFEKYDYKHRYLTSALCAKSSSVFVLSVDEVTAMSKGSPSSMLAPELRLTANLSKLAEHHAKAKCFSQPEVCS